MQYCSLQHRTLLLSPVTSTAGYCFCFGSIPSFFLGLFLHWSPVAYWAPTDLGSSSFSILSFAFSYCSWGSQGKNTEVVCHSLLQWTSFCQISAPWPTCSGWPHKAWLSFTELDKAVDTSCKELTHWKRLWCWEGLGAGGEWDDRGWDGWMASLIRWTRVWVGHDWATELNFNLKECVCVCVCVCVFEVGVKITNENNDNF